MRLILTWAVLANSFLLCMDPPSSKPTFPYLLEPSPSHPKKIVTIRDILRDIEREQSAAHKKASVSKEKDTVPTDPQTFDWCFVKAVGAYEKTLPASGNVSQARTTAIPETKWRPWIPGMIPPPMKKRKLPSSTKISPTKKRRKED